MFHLFRMYDYEAAKSFPKFPSIVQEKYDGVRAIYNPKNSTFVLRTGRALHMPTNFIDTEYMLDGELTAETFDLVNSIVRRKIISIPVWRENIKFHVFDIADKKLNKIPYSERYRLAESEASKNKGFCLPVANLGMASSIPEIIALRDIVVNRGGEGVISRYVDGTYENGRSYSDFKFKKEYTVTGTVSGYMISNTTRFKYGAILVSIPELNIEEQTVGSGLTDLHRKDLKSISTAFPIGSKVNLKYMETTKHNKLRMPRLVTESS